MRTVKFIHKYREEYSNLSTIHEADESIITKDGMNKQLHKKQTEIIEKIAKDLKHVRNI